MKIEIGNDSGYQTLVDGPVRPTDYTYAQGPIGDIEFTDDALIQLAPRLRGTVRAVYSRGNVVATCTFGALRVFASTLAAKSWLATHMLTVRRSHTLRITEGGGTVLLKSGALGPIKARPRGIELTLTYTFTFSEVS